MVAESSAGLVLDVEDLGVCYLRARERIEAVRGVSFQVRRGERLAVIGESGAGKSTIANALLGLLPGNAVIDSGVARFGDRDLLAIRSEREWNRIRGGAIAFIPQDPNIALDPVKRVGQQIDETLRLHRRLRDRRELRRRSVELLGQAGLPEAERVYDAFPHQLSGGQRQRVLIAIALGGEPELIIADEPTSGLDVTVQKLVLDALDDLVRSRGLSVLLITHDLAVAAQRTDSVVVLRDGRVVDRGDTVEVVASPRHSYTRRLFEAAPSRSARRLTATPRPAAGHAERDRPQRPDAAHLVTVTGLHKSYVTRGMRSGKTVKRAVREVSFAITEGTTYGLVGESGSGKSTVARIVAGIDRPDCGTIAYRGRDVAHAGRAERRRLHRAVQYVFQNPYSSLDPRLDVAEIVAEPLHGFKIGARGERLDRAAEALVAVGLDTSFLRRKPVELSGGQRQRVAIARAIALRPELIVLDEPTSALDVSVQAQVLRLLVDLQHEFGLTYLFISHDLGVIRLVSDRVGVLHNGALVEEAPVEQIFTGPRQDYTRRLIDAIPAAPRTESSEPSAR
ncbi:peptide/nickel transport system ATP-binding protein [Thermomonospora echinospora]|uniref:Peptide/nickel transport system ATP-binding protein n=1 Tax=Thermomonospora echinospora TaxID=1992 RepID=A0A1H6E0E5_9ACTN|nr:ABC transporter ATP-binding protein [Thermomonospora echinospora]SEG90385.1 peptide/nickel transport system ATP-binding protein [Thermomonospora echinospora]